MIRVLKYLTLFIWVCQVGFELADHTPLWVAEWIWGPL